jgi:hypothetical protein
MLARWKASAALSSSPDASHFLGELLADLGSLDPLGAPVVPRVDALRKLSKVLHEDPHAQEAWRPHAEDPVRPTRPAQQPFQSVMIISNGPPPS